MTIVLDGTQIDLDRVQTALEDDSRWLWTCEHTDAGEPLMQRIDRLGEVVLPLSVVYRDHGPLTPDSVRTPAALYRQVLEAAS
ncbi:phiSA1p31-related protein [Streptomyces sp. ActVer]|uniref:phiSA1p31-related protein n=1 Tax=Streptomyces sp. ActVer TaxID=3014558 RepID=UPI0022B519BC|nr:phiSA1p31-related protein [Streptomyces sp. ActVer]MCZ4509926.1 phiSA1p31-related protein [Streptomyces sp. ActVer]